MYIFNSIIFVLLCCNIYFSNGFSFGSGSSPIIEVTDNNWRKLLEGCFNIHSPWCEACKEMIMGWNHIATWSADSSPKIRVADIDATKNAESSFIWYSILTVIIFLNFS